SPREGTRRASCARAPRRCAAATDRSDRAGSRRSAPRRSRALHRHIGPAYETRAAPEVALHEVGALVADERVAVALARHEIWIDLRDKKMFFELRSARDDGAVGRDDLGAAPEGDTVLVPHAVREKDIERQVLRVETVHQPARLRGAEVAALGDAAARARCRRQHHRRAGRGVGVRDRDVPEVLADGEAGRTHSALEYIEAVARTEVAAVGEE